MASSKMACGPFPDRWMCIDALVEALGGLPANCGKTGQSRSSGSSGYEEANQGSRKGGGRWKDAERVGSSGARLRCSKSHRANRTGSGIRPMKKNGSRTKQAGTATECSRNRKKDKIRARAATAVNVRQCR
jgi:hypothetical protein